MVSYVILKNVKEGHRPKNGTQILARNYSVKVVRTSVANVLCGINAEVKWPNERVRRRWLDAEPVGGRVRILP